MMQTHPVAGGFTQPAPVALKKAGWFSLFLLLLVSVCFNAHAQPPLVEWRNAVALPEDINQAEALARKYPDDPSAFRFIHQTFTFDRGENSYKDKVVTVRETSEMELIALQHRARAWYPQYYNNFVKIISLRGTGSTKGKQLPGLFYQQEDRSVTDDGIFFDDNRMRFSAFSFNGPGNLGQINVIKDYLDSKYFTRIFFHEHYPLLEKVITFKVPEWLTIDIKPFNMAGFKVEKSEEQKKGYTCYTYKVTNLEASKSESKQIGRAFSDPHLVIRVKSYERKGDLIKGFDKVDDVYNWNNRMYTMARNEPSKLKSTVSKIVAGKNTDEEKIKAIYYWVQDKIRYIAYEDGYSGFIPSNAQDVLESKFGDCKGMANLLTEMLKLQGYDARFSWIGTRQIPYSQSLPALCVNNHAITTLYFKDKTYFLDATEKFIPLGEDAYRIQGKEALVSKGDKFEIIPVPLTDGKAHKVSTKADFTLNAQNMKGNVQVILTGNERTDFHQLYQDLASVDREKFFKSFLQLGNDNIEVSNITNSDLSNREIPVQLSGVIDLSNHVHKIDKDLFLNLDFFPKTLESYMPDEKRKRGYEFNSVLTYEDEFSLSIPADKKFTDVPEKLQLNFAGYEFSGEYVVSGNKITLKKSLSIKNSTINKADFDNWKKFLKSIKSFNSYYFSITQK